VSWTRCKGLLHGREQHAIQLWYPDGLARSRSDAGVALYDQNWLLSSYEMSEYEDIRSHTRQELARIKQQTMHGDDSEVFAWVIPHQLAGAHRPLRYDPVYYDPVLKGRGPLPLEARGDVERWVDRILEELIQTVFCLATSEELRRYDDLGLHADGFLAYLEERGLIVRHFPLTDPAHLTSGAGSWKETQLLPVQRDAAAVYPQVDKPVLVFCSGGADRTPPVVAYLVTVRNG
jgi:hypothetical protein